tara:strand:+ start:3318 stop:6032 length:2715 start_codon:yes stop_codon:yes gene_type:complete
MALTNPRLFGLNINSLLTDVEKKNTAIQNLGINPLDLDIIRGSKDAAMDRFDWISFSRLKSPIYKTLDRFSNESTTFVGILLNRAGTDQTLFGNLDINGSLSGSAIRYRYRDFKQGSFRIADISTSRVSAWSSSDSRANNQDLSVQKLARISYGARVGIIDGGKLQFGPQSTATKALGNASNATFDQGVAGPAGQTRLQTTIVPEAKEFPSELPTSTIRCKIGNDIVRLYAMKGIPLVFKGFFRNLDAEIKFNYINIGGENIKASWKIVETGNANLYTNYLNKGTNTSTVNYRSPVSRERFIKFYYNPNKITSIQIRNANIKELPAVRLSNLCETLDFAYNNIKTFPNFDFIAPNLLTLKTMRNQFYLSDIEGERSFNTAVLNKIPQSLRTLEFEGSFYGSIVRNIISARLPNLISFNCGRGGGVAFNQDSRPTGSTRVKLNNTLTTGNNAGSDSFCPDVPRGVTYYHIGSNDFRSVDVNDIGDGETIDGIKYDSGSCSFKKLPALQYLYVGGNYYLNDGKSGGDYSLASGVPNNTIIEIDYSTTALKMPTNLAGCPSLTKYFASYNRDHANQLLVGTAYKFAGCVNLKQLRFYATNLGLINFPNFTNELLEVLDLRYTSIKGGAPGLSDGLQTSVITANTFKDATALKDLRINSGNLGSGFATDKKVIDALAFNFNTNLETLEINSGGALRGGISSLFNNNPNLRYLNLTNNSFTGSPPNFLNNSNLTYVNLSSNQLDGTIPSYTGAIQQLYLQNNQLVQINTPGTLSSLSTYQAHNNAIAGDIPDFSGCTNLRSLTLNNNKFTNYKIGAFVSLYKINYIDLSFNHLSSIALDNILVDLLDNWKSVKRGGVTINLKNQRSETNPDIRFRPSETGYAAARELVNNGWSIGLTFGIPDEPEEEVL